MPLYLPKILNMKYILYFLLLSGFCGVAQSISAEWVDVKLLLPPKTVLEEGQRTYRVTVSSPYNLTADQVRAQALADHEQALADYANVVAQSEKDFAQKLKDYDSEVKRAQEKYEIEMAAFKKLSVLERLAMQDAGTAPKLVTPSKPEYFKPYPPQYREPNLDDYAIVDNNVLASLISISGFSREGSYVEISVDIKKVSFQDTAGQTYANQPTKLVVKVGGVEKVNKMFFQDYAFISSSPSNNINKAREEKNHLNKVIAALNTFLDENFGFRSKQEKVKIEVVKNKGKYDDLEKADIYVKTNLRKLQPSDPAMTAAAFAGMQKGIDIWTQTLAKVDYKDTKADFNAKIAEYLYKNLIRLNVALGRKKEAEQYLNQFQENQIYMKLSYDDEQELRQLESLIYSK